MEIFSQMKNLRTLKLLDVYEPAQDDSKSLVNLEMAMMVIRTRFSMETEVKISVGGSALKEPNGTEYHRITTAGNFILQNINLKVIMCQQINLYRAISNFYAYF